MAATIDNTYPLAALLIHASNQEVTAESMEKVFKVLSKNNFSSKLASMFCLSAEKYKELMLFTGSSVQSATGGETSQAAAEENVEEKAVEESSSEAVSFGF